MNYDQEAAAKSKIEQFVPLVLKEKTAKTGTDSKPLLFNDMSEINLDEADLEPLEILPFDPKTLRGLNFHEQIKQR